MKSTKNRKYVSGADTVIRNGHQYAINARKSGIYPQQLHAIIDQLDICIAKWRRVFMLRIDLHQDHYTDDSGMITKLRKNLCRRLERQYGISEVGYAWVREQEKAKRQHYHFVLFLDGDKIRHSTNVNKIVADTWAGVKSGNTVHHPQNCFTNVVDDDTKARAVYRFSYMAKARGKGYRPPQAKDYGTSRLVMPRAARRNALASTPA